MPPVCVIVGSGEGLGSALATKFAQEGFEIGLVSRSAKGSAKALEAVAKTRASSRVRYFAADAYQPETIETAINLISDDLGDIDVLVNNAGITRDNLLMRMKETEWDDIIDTNLSSVFRLSKAVLRPMMKKKKGRIINIGSVVGTMGNAGQANYAAAKAGVIGFSKSLAREVASRGITVNVIAPGFIQTDMTDNLTDEQKAATLANVPAGRLGQPDEIAAAVCYLASDAAAYVSGETLHVNGAMYMV